MKRSVTIPSFRDPVCGMSVSQATATDESEYQDKTYFFCAPTCRQSFEDNPEKYIRQHRQHGLKLP